MLRRLNLLEQVINSGTERMTPELARYFLTLDFPAESHARYAQLATKAQEGSLSKGEQAELEEFLSVNSFLTIIQSKARVSLKKKRNPAA
jgi:hypothetical protein